MLDIVEDGGTLRITRATHPFLRFLARLMPPIAVLMVAVSALDLAGIGHRTASTASAIGTIVLGILVLGTFLMPLGVAVTVDRATRVVRMHKRFAYRPARQTEVAFSDIRAIEIFNDGDSYRRSAWISVWLNRQDGRSVCLIGPVDQRTHVAAIGRAAELAHSLIGAPVTRRH